MNPPPPEYRLLHPTDVNEDARKANIREWLHSLGINDVKTEYSTGDGPADIYLAGRRVLIETKKRGKANPDDDTAGSKRGETPLQQITRYLNAERPNEQRTLDDGDNMNLPWLGIITDSEIWHVYEWTATGFTYLVDWMGRRLDSSNIVELERLFQRRVGKEWAPEDPTYTFKPFLESLRVLYEAKRDERSVITQKVLWYRQLEISGNQPPVPYEDELFILHTLLISISTKISAKYGNEEYRYGFASWVGGTQWLDDLDCIIDKYNWKPQTGDVLRALYMGLVDKTHRHIYGEYYTPDWLAEKLCADVIDDDYIERWVNGEGVGGVMDPACGSGTFLYHAIRRIINSKPIQGATMNERDITDMLVKMIHGIDIHPVAVAMAKANVLRALPRRPSEPLRIYQGDSLQISRNIHDAQQRIDEGVSTFSITSREGVDIRFPLEFVMCGDFDVRMQRFAKAAAEQKRFPPRIDEGISEESKSVIRRAFDTLTKICLDEGNGIWAWYVIQYVGVYKLRNHISRMVANPPWVRASSIRDKQRKSEVESLAKDLGLWVGGKNATGFNIAALFVVQCKRLYGAEKSGWVLPDAAMRSGNWEKYIELAKPPAVWDLGDLPFPKHSEACVNIFGVPYEKPKRLELDGARPTQSEGWDTVRKRVSFGEITLYTPKKSAWFRGTRTIARQGATITPSCLVILGRYDEVDGMVSGITRKSIHGNWHGKSFSVNGIPKSWVRRVLFSKEGLLPYRIGQTRDVILPIDEDGAFLPERNNIKWWRDASDKYAHNRGLGANTPKTLEKQLDFGDKLSNQFPIRDHIVLYNKSGSNMRATRLKEKHIIDHTLYRVATDSEEEALFLTGILNADIMRDRFQHTRRSKRDFHTYFWDDVPIPRYDKNNTHHAELVELVLKVENIVRDVQSENPKKIRELLRVDGVAAEIDAVVERIIQTAERDMISG